VTEETGNEWADRGSSVFRSQAREDAYLDAGIWGTQPLDALLRHWSGALAGRLAIADSGDREQWTSGAPRALSFSELEAEVARIAGLMVTLELKPDTVVGMQMPNTTDAVVFCLAAWRAGLIVSLFPPYWRASELVPALAECGAKALFTTDRVESDEIGLRLRDVAADAFNIRFLLGVGDDLPEGMIDLVALSREPGIEPLVAAPPRKENPANHVAVITWAEARDGSPVAVPRSHNHLIAAGLGLTVDSALGPKTRLLSTLGPSSLRGLASGLAPWLISGATLHCHHFRNLGGLVGQCVSEMPDIAVLPGALAPYFVKGLAKRSMEPPRLAAVWTCDASDGALPVPFPTAVTDIICLGEAGLMTAPRGAAAKPAPLKVGAHKRPREGEKPDLVDLSFGEFELDTSPEDARRPRQLYVKGPMVPQYTWRDYRAAGTARSQMAQMYYGMATGLYGVLDISAGGVVLPLEPAPASTSVAGHSMPLKELDALYRAHPAVEDAAALFVPDPRLGKRLMAAIVPKADIPFDPSDFRAFLTERKVAVHKHPHSVVLVPMIPRLENGRVERQMLTAAAMQRQSEAEAAAPVEEQEPAIQAHGG